ncbi:MAG: hypothetical protein HY553_20035 [Elusimicrobia bacterium]|nr:hypothetical protein [Elusimicrobiota bacterium]
MSRRRSSRKRWVSASAAAGAAIVVWWALLPGPITPEDRLAAARAARAALSSGTFPADGPRAWRRKTPSVAAVTAYGPGGFSRTETGDGETPWVAVRAASLRLAARGPLEEVSRVQIEWSTAAPAALDPAAAQAPAWSAVALGHFAVLAEAAPAGAWRKTVFPGAWVQSGWASENRPLRELLRDWARFEGSPAPGGDVLTFAAFPAAGLVESADRAGTWTLSGGRPTLVARGRDALLQGADAAGRWLSDAQLPTGRFHYRYDALTDEFDDGRYNLPRHSGTAYALFQLFAARGGGHLAEAGTAAMAFVKPLLTPGRTPGARFVRERPGGGSLGSSALALVAHAEGLLAGALADADASRRADALARWIVEMQRPDGSFRTQFGPGADEKSSDEQSYYPGEALFGLLRYHRTAKTPRWLDAARLGARHRLRRQRESGAPVYDTWFIHALRELNLVEPSPEYVEHAAVIARRMVETLRSDASGPFAPVSLGALCSRVEGVLSAVGLFRDAGRTPPADLTSFLRTAAPVILDAQFNLENGYYLRDPARAAGAFMGTTLNHKTRVDVVHHCLSAELGLAGEL